MKLIILITLLLFDADFRQTHTSAMLAAPVVQTGHMHYAAPDSLEWHYDGEKATTLPAPVLRAIRTMIAEPTAVRNGWTTLSPLPRSIARLFAEIRLRIENGTAREVVLIETSGEQTHIEFLHPTCRTR